MVAQDQDAGVDLLSTSGAARALGVSRRRVLQLIADRRLPARMVGSIFLIRPGDLARVADRRPGRPRKAADHTGDKSVEWALGTHE